MKRPSEKQAEKILANLSLDTAPVPVDEVARMLGAKLSFEPFDDEEDISGVLYRSEDQIVIGINSKHVKSRQRFSIAHEIGHLVLHKGALFVDKAVRLNRDSISAKAIDPKEIQANQFAAALLMPESLVLGEVRKRVSKRNKLSEEELIAELADVFAVSTQSMEYRLINLGIL